MMMKRRVFPIIAMALVISASTVLAADKSKREQAFDRLASLQRERKGVADGISATVIYPLTANGSALMEQCRQEKGHEMITMFTTDGDRLVATHYCSANNQPQMAPPPITDVQKPLAFSLVRVTGLKSRDDFHNT